MKKKKSVHRINIEAGSKGPKEKKMRNVSDKIVKEISDTFKPTFKGNYISSNLFPH